VLFQVVEKNGQVSITPCGDNNISISVENEKEIEQLPWLIAKPSLCPSPQVLTRNLMDLKFIFRAMYFSKEI